MSVFVFYAQIPMRPWLLDPLFAPASSLAGVGPKTGKLYDRLLGQGGREARIIDILFHIPHECIDRRNRPPIAQAPIGAVVTVRGRVRRHQPPAGKGPYRVLLEDDTGDLLLVFFRAQSAWMEKALPLGETRWVSGLLELWDGHRQMAHPHHIVDEDGLTKLPMVEPVYGLTEGLFPKVAVKAVASALKRLPDLPEWLEEGTLRRGSWPSFQDALRQLHEPHAPQDLAPESPARLRLAYDEFLSHQLALLMVRAERKERSGRALCGDGRLRARIRAAVPFTLTASQEEALREIDMDMREARRMSRLLQGDVGSGKTIVALLALAAAVETGCQGALMAPTEILARQHYETIAPLAEAAGLSIALMTGRDTTTQRRATLEGLANGAISIVIGTHALVQEDVNFHDLALAVIDEQHRFGVHQRLALGDKGEAADVLVMTATPIPRTLALTYFGDMDISALREKPPGRLPIDTRTVSIERIGDIVAGLGRALKSGARAYWICPLVAESEDSDLAAAEARADDLKKFFGDAVGLVHGKMKGKDKDAAMEAFQNGTVKILVSTTVVEVGVNVPEASIMIIEHAERFGLAQLHQLRGRVGRGAAKSTCILLYRPPLGAVSKARLSILRETEDGFRIAEEDLRLRGEGDALGARQSGAPGFRLAQIDAHAPLLRAAREEAERILKRDPHLQSEASAPVRLLMHLFERQDALRLFQAG